MEFLLIFWLGFALVVGVAANTRGRNGIGWFFLAVLISLLTRGPFGFGLAKRLSPHRRGNGNVLSVPN
jgi:hypothetical protein